MLIHEKGPFVRGSILLISFLVLFCVLLTPSCVTKRATT